jgi:hypothetical protein
VVELVIVRGFYRGGVCDCVWRVLRETFLFDDVVVFYWGG